MNARKISSGLWLLVWLGLALYFFLTLWLGFVGLVFPYQLDYGEGIVLWFARALAHGQSIYKGLTGFPYASSNYPPLAILLSAMLTPIFGDGYTSGRLLNFASALIVAALIYRIVRGETNRPRAGLLAALFFIGSPYVYHWVPLFRVDLIGLGFTFTGIYFVWKREQTTDHRQQRIYFLLFTFFFLLGLCTKHSLIAAPAAAFLALLLRDKRTAFAFAIVLGTIGGMIYLVLEIITRGAFTFGIVTSNATVFLAEQLGSQLKNFGVTFAVLIAFAAWVWIQRVRAGKFNVLEAYALTAFAALLFAGRIGAWENYFFEAIAVVCVLASANSKFIIHNSKFNSSITNYEHLPSRAVQGLRIKNYALPLLLLLQLILYTRDHDPRIAANLVADDLPANRELASLLSRTLDPIISEDMGALVTSGKQIPYYTFQYSSLARAGIWNQSWELNGLREGLFPLVILERGTREDVDHYRRFTREFVSNLDRHYQKSSAIGKYQIYQPAPLLRLQSEDFGDTIALVGWSTLPSNLQSPLSNLQIIIVWQAMRAIPRRYTAFAHLENSSGGKVTQDDHEPLRGIYPTTRWAAGELVRDVYSLTVPPSLPAGKYVVRVGWYDSETGERLQVRGSEEGAVLIVTFETERQ